MSPSLLAGIHRAVARQGERPAILGAKALSYEALWALSGQVAAWLSDRGYGKGQRLALYAPNGSEFVVLYLAILRAGAVVVPVNLLIQLPEIAHVLSDSGASAVLVHAGLLPKIDEALALMDEPTPRRHPFDDLPTVAAGLADFLGDASSSPPSLIEDSSDDLAAILYTSGTTGFPKGAMLSHGNLGSNVRAVIEALEWSEGAERILVVLPMFHAFAATVGVLAPLTQGCALIPLARFEPQGLCEAVQQLRATVFLGVPSMFNLLLRLPTAFDQSLASLRYAVSGGAALPPSVLEAFEQKFHVPILEGDGPTECSPVTCVNPPRGPRKPGTVGLPIPGVAMCILDEAGETCADGVVGEVAVRGPNVMKGYWRRPEETAAVMKGDWFLTGDLGTRDGEGYFSLIDRKKDLILVNGMNVYPRMIEDVLRLDEDILDAAVVGLSDPRHGEVPVAFLVSRSGTVDSAKLRRHCRKHLGPHQTPRQFHVLEALPRNAGGKVLKRALRNQGELERGVALRLGGSPDFKGDPSPAEG